MITKYLIAMVFALGVQNAAAELAFEGAKSLPLKEAVAAANANRAAMQANLIAPPGAQANVAAFQFFLKQNEKSFIIAPKSKGQPEKQIIWAEGAVSKKSNTIEIVKNNIDAIVAAQPEVARDSRIIDGFTSVDPRIFIGFSLGNNQRPETVGIVGYEINFGQDVSIAGICTGTVLGKRTVLTAAHCYCELGKNVAIVEGASNLFALVPQIKVTGATSLIADCKSYQQASKEKKIEMLKQTGDIALYYVSEDLRSAPAILDSRFQSKEAYRIVGYGLNELGKSGRKALGTVIAVECSAADEVKYGCNPLGEFWAAGNNEKLNVPGTDTCSGDSGGPVFRVSDTEPPAIVGVTSRGLTGAGCGYGGIYVRLTDQLLAWMGTRIDPATFPVLVSGP